jgi:O-antigen/teichoic acid export membrane protein
VAANILVSRTLGPEGRGQYALATLCALTIVALGKIGLEHANVFLLGTARVAPERLASQNVLIALVAGLPGAAVLLAAPIVFPSIFGDLSITNLALAALAIPFLLHVQLAAGLQNLTGLITWQFRAALTGASANLAIVGALLALGRLDVGAALGANLGANVLVWTLVVLRGPAGTLRPRRDLGLLIRTLRYSLVIHIGLVLLFFQTRITLFIVQALLGTGPLGYYSLAVSIAESVLLAGDSVAIALLPRQAQGSLAASAALGLRGARVGGLLVLAVGLPLAAFGPAIIGLVFGDQFAASYPPLLALLPGIALFAVQRFCGVPALRANRPAWVASIYALGVVINVGLALWWIPTAGLVGAAASTSVSYLVTALLFLRWAQVLAGSRDQGPLPSVSEVAQ